MRTYTADDVGQCPCAMMGVWECLGSADKAGVTYTIDPVRERFTPQGVRTMLHALTMKLQSGFRSPKTDGGSLRVRGPRPQRP
jgi:hypothetical protein